MRTRTSGRLGFQIGILLLILAVGMYVFSLLGSTTPGAEPERWRSLISMAGGAGVGLVLVTTLFNALENGSEALVLGLVVLSVTAEIVGMIASVWFMYSLFVEERINSTAGLLMLAFFATQSNGAHTETPPEVEGDPVTTEPGTVADATFDEPLEAVALHGDSEPDLDDLFVILHEGSWRLAVPLDLRNDVMQMIVSTGGWPAPADAFDLAVIAEELSPSNRRQVFIDHEDFRNLRGAPIGTIPAIER